jgi:hypothetical protein
MFSDLERAVELALWLALAFASVMGAALVVERAAFWYRVSRRARVERRYEPLVQRALSGDESARAELVASPSRHRLTVAAMLSLPHIDDRHPERIARSRAIGRAMSMIPIADRLLRSRRSWRRAVALRWLGLLQIHDRTGAIISALDDSNPEIRAAALDALTDLQDPAAVQAVVVRLHDTSLQRSRRVTALASFGAQCEPFLLDLAEADPAHRLNYLRALALCGTERSRPALCQWTGDQRTAVRAAAFEALAHVGLDDHAASLAIAALESGDVSVRAMAASALRGWTGPGDAASHLVRHLDDAWTVATAAARSLQSMAPDGLFELQVSASRSDLPGALARQMLWETEMRC